MALPVRSPKEISQPRALRHVLQCSLPIQRPPGPPGAFPSRTLCLLGTRKGAAKTTKCISEARFFTEICPRFLPRLHNHPQKKSDNPLTGLMNLFESKPLLSPRL